jgi:hypothetical protein
MWHVCSVSSSNCMRSSCSRQCKRATLCLSCHGMWGAVAPTCVASLSFHVVSVTSQTEAFACIRPRLELGRMYSAAVLIAGCCMLQLHRCQ